MKMLIFYIVMAVILLPGVKIAKHRQWQENPLSQSVSKGIQGFFALLVILHHLEQTIRNSGGNPGILSEVRNAGVLCVAVFFFFSGYGLYISYHSKNNYLHGFLRNRLSTVLIPFYVCTVVFLGVNLMTGVHYEAIDFILTLVGWNLVNSHMWFIVEITLFYIFFYLAFKFIKKEWIAIGVIVIAITTIVIWSLYRLHGDHWFQGEWWYNTSFVFVIGILVAKYQEQLKKFAQKIYVVILPGLVLAFILLMKLNLYCLGNYSYWSEFVPGRNHIKDKFICLLVQLPMVVVFVLLILVIMMKVKFANPMLAFLGSISLEVYLIHNLFLTRLRNGTSIEITNDFLFVIITIIGSIVVASMIHWINHQLILRIRKK